MLENLSEKYEVPAPLIRKLMEAELQVSGLGNRRGILQKLDSILRQDWDDLESINERNADFRKLGKSHVDEVRNEFAEFIE